MKARPKPKKISFIKLTTKANKNDKNDNKANNIKENRAKKANTVLNSNLLFINSPRTNINPPTSKYNEKFSNKIKEYSLESQLINEIVRKNTKNANKINFNKETEDAKNNLTEFKFNSLDNNNIINNVKKIKNRNTYTNKYNTERQENPFSKNIKINTTTNNEFEFNKNYKKNKKNILSNKTKSLSKRKRKEVLENNLKISKQNIQKNNIKRNISSNNRLLGHKKIINRQESNDESNINNTEENNKIDIHKSYNLTLKNSFNFYYPDIQFLSAKNMLEKKWRYNKINNEIKEESARNLIKSENKDKHNMIRLELSFKKSKTNISSKMKKLKKSYKNYKEIKSENINDLKVNKKIKKINRKENTLSSLHKNRIIFPNTNKDALSFFEFKRFYSPDAYSYDQGKSPNDKIKAEKNKYFILNKNKIYKNKRSDIVNQIEKENTKNNYSYKLRQNGGSFYTKRKIYENKKKSPNINRIDEQINDNNNDKRMSFLNSPNIKATYINKNRNEYSYDNTYSKYNNFKFHKLKKNKENSESKSNSKSKSKSKSRSKSNLNKLKTYNKNINILNKLILIIKTNWGNSLKLGINNIKLLDKNNKNIPIKFANFDTSKPFLTKFNKGEVKKLIIEFESDYTLGNIVILNGFNDTGVKYLLIENDRGKLIWKGVIPKANLINIKSFYISLDSKLINKKKFLFSKTMYLSKIENNSNSNINNLKQVNNNTLENSRIVETEENSNKNFVLCDRLKIKLLDNYGNKDYIGLSGIQFYDNNNKLINIIQNKKEIKINEAIVNLKEKKILYNLFNNKNDTINPKYMFLTTNLNAFINIEFKQSIKISKIIFYNYNNNIYKDCATKGIFIDFYINNKKQNIMNKPIYLYKPPGEEKIDYGQIFIYPFTESNYFINQIKVNLAKIKFDYNKNIYNEENQYYCPSFPFGYILKIEIFSNYGNKNYIGIENIQLFNEENKEIILFPPLSKAKTKETNNNYPKIYLMPEGTPVKSKAKPLILSRLYNFNDVNNNLGENRVYFIFNQCIGLSRICIINYEKYLEIAAKHIKILLDDNIIFEGDLKNIEINNIFFAEKEYLCVKKEKNKIIDKKNNNTSKEFEYKLNEFRQSINDKINIDRYVEYEGKNGTKILKLSE